MADTSEDQMVVDSSDKVSASPTPSPVAANVDSDVNSPKIGGSVDDEPLTLDDLHLLADLFYLPFEHGRKGISLMTEFNWLKSNSQLVILHNRDNPDGTRKPEVCSISIASMYLKI